MGTADARVEMLELWLESQDTIREKARLAEKAERKKLEQNKRMQFDLKWKDAELIEIYS